MRSRSDGSATCGGFGAGRSTRGATNTNCVRSRGGCSRIAKGFAGGDANSAGKYFGETRITMTVTRWKMIESRITSSRVSARPTG